LVTLFHVLAFLSSSALLAARATYIGPFIFPVLISVLNGTTDHLSCVLGNDEIESQLERDRLVAKNEIKMLLLGAGESGEVRHWNPYTDRRGLNAFSQ